MTMSQPMTRRLAAFAALMALLVIAAPALANKREPLIVHTGNGPHTFAVEVADTPESRAKGLMHREYLNPRHGMLFDFKKPQRVSMWMRNTVIPLDMLFVDHRGLIIHIEYNAAPHSTNPRGPNAHVLGVLELAGGTARALGIRPGDTVDHAMFKRGLGGRR